MYFWNIKKLKKEIVNSSLTDHQVFSYFIAYIAFEAVMFAIGDLIPTEAIGFWDYTAVVLEVIVVLGGVYYAYYSNGGKEGRHFLSRFFPLSWVIGIRVGLILVPAAIICITIWYSIVDPLNQEAGDDTMLISTGAPDVILIFVFMVFYYWRLSVHIADVSQRHIS